MNPYRILGIRKNASAATITRAYRAKSKQAHPDAGGNSETFEALKTARDVLLDPVRRKRFDETGHVEPVVPDNTVEAAMNLISGLLVTILQDDRDPFKMDLVASMIMSLEKACDEIAKRLPKLKRTKDRMGKMRGRFSRKTGENAIDRMLDWHGRQIDQAIAQTESSLRVHRKAAEILSDYDFRRDAPEQVFQTFIQFRSTSTASTGW
jgi:curved DNA-binding protein CbpA